MKSEIVTVWRTGKGRRFFTKKAAVMRDARDRLKKKPRHEPDIIDRLVGGEHEQTIAYTAEQLEKLHAISLRYWKMYGKRIGQ